MPSCEACRDRHVACRGDGVNPCGNCKATGQTCVYPKRLKAGPRQGWLKDLKQQVADLKEQLHAAQTSPVPSFITIAPSTVTTTIGPREVYLLHDFIINGNSLVIILPEQTPEEFIRRASHIPRGTDAAGFAAKQAVLNAVLALSGLQQLPLLIPTTSSKEANREQCAKIASVGNAKQLAHKAAHPYFERAKDAMKECFALPNLNTTSALLALSQCCQIMDDTTSAYLYANMALSMCDLAGDAIPEEVRAACKFLKQIRSLPQANRKEQAFVGSTKARFLEILGQAMAAARTSSVQLTHNSLPSSSTSAGTNKESHASSWSCNLFLPIFEQLDEAELLCETAALPSSALLWVLCLRGRFWLMSKDFTPRNPVQLASLISLLTKVSEIMSSAPRSMQDPMSLYALYSVSLALLENMSLEGKTWEDCREGCPITSLIRIQRAMGLVWPLANTLLRYVDCGVDIDEGTMDKIQSVGGIEFMKCPSGKSNMRQGSAEVADAAKAALQGMPPPPKSEPDPLPDSVMGGLFNGLVCCDEARETTPMASSTLQGMPAAPSSTVTSEQGSIFMHIKQELFEEEELFHKASSDASEPLLSGDEYLPRIQANTVHTREEFGVPVFNHEQEGLLDQLIEGIIQDDEVDLDMLIAEINNNDVKKADNFCC